MRHVLWVRCTLFPTRNPLSPDVERKLRIAPYAASSSGGLPPFGQRNGGMIHSETDLSLLRWVGERRDDSSLRSFRLADGSQEPKVGGCGGEQDNDDDPDDILHRYCGGRR